MDLDPHRDEEEGDEEGREGPHHLRQGGLLRARPDALPVRVQQGAGAEGPDDVGEAHPFSGEGQREAEGQPERQQDAGLAGPGGQAEDRLRQQVPEPHRDAQEQDGADEDAAAGRQQAHGGPRALRPPEEEGQLDRGADLQGEEGQGDPRRGPRRKRPVALSPPAPLREGPRSESQVEDVAGLAVLANPQEALQCLPGQVTRARAEGQGHPGAPARDGEDQEDHLPRDPQWSRRTAPPNAYRKPADSGGHEGGAGSLGVPCGGQGRLRQEPGEESAGGRGRLRSQVHLSRQSIHLGPAQNFDGRLPPSPTPLARGKTRDIGNAFPSRSPRTGPGRGPRHIRGSGARKRLQPEPVRPRQAVARGPCAGSSDLRAHFALLDRPPP